MGRDSAAGAGVASGQNFGAGRVVDRIDEFIGADLFGDDREFDLVAKRIALRLPIAKARKARKAEDDRTVPPR